MGRWRHKFTARRLARTAASTTPTDDVCKHSRTFTPEGRGGEVVVTQGEHSSSLLIAVRSMYAQQ